MKPEDIKIAEDKSFESWLGTPVSKVLISTIPPCDHLQTLLESAHSSGFASGIAFIILKMLQESVRNRRDD